MNTCPRCKRMVSAGDSQCETCGEFLKPDRKSAKADSEPPPRNPYPMGDESGVPIPPLPGAARLGPPAVWWMFACAVVAGISTAFAFWSYSDIFLVVAIVALAMIFTPFLLLILGYTFTLAVIARKELTYVAIALAALAGIWAIGWGVSKMNISLDFQSVLTLFQNENFTRVVITLVVCVTLALAVFPLATGLNHYLAGRCDVAGYTAESQRELGLHFNDNDVKVKLKTLEMQKEIEIKKLELRQQELTLRAQLESKPQLLIEQVAGAPGAGAARLTNRVQRCVECGTTAYFSAVNLSSDLCDEHNRDFASKFRRCQKCNEAVPHSSYAAGEKICPACLRASRSHGVA